MSKIFNLKERTYRYSLEIIRFLEKMPSDFISRTLAQQLIRSATSVGANVAEAQSARSKKEFVSFYSHSLKSAKESVYWLRLIADARRGAADSQMILNESQELIKILSSCILTAKGKVRSVRV